jgi:hypothetical protein
MDPASSPTMSQVSSQHRSPWHPLPRKCRRLGLGFCWCNYDNSVGKRHRVHTFWRLHCRAIVDKNIVVAPITLVRSSGTSKSAAATMSWGSVHTTREIQRRAARTVRTSGVTGKERHWCVAAVISFARM